MKVLLVLAVAFLACASARRFRLNLNADANKFVNLHDNPRPFTSSNDPVSTHSHLGSVSVEHGNSAEASASGERRVGRVWYSPLSWFASETEKTKGRMGYDPNNPLTWNFRSGYDSLCYRRDARVTGQPFVNQAGYVDGSKLVDEPCGAEARDDIKLNSMEVQVLKDKLNKWRGARAYDVNSHLGYLMRAYNPPTYDPIPL